MYVVDNSLGLNEIKSSDTGIHYIVVKEKDDAEAIAIILNAFCDNYEDKPENRDIVSRFILKYNHPILIENGIEAKDSSGKKIFLSPNRNSIKAEEVAKQVLICINVMKKYLFE